MLAPAHPRAQWMLRWQDTNFRKVERLATLLVKIGAKTPLPTPSSHTQYEGESHDVDENKGPRKALLEYPTMLLKTNALIFVIPRSR
jgi:hypothetical protein